MVYLCPLWQWPTHLLLGQKLFHTSANADYTSTQSQHNETQLSLV